MLNGLVGRIIPKKKKKELANEKSFRSQSSKTKGEKIE